MDLLGIDPASLALLLLAALLGGAVDAVAGGGGLIVLPALLATGLPPHLALGTNKVAGTFGTLSASGAYLRRRLIDPRRWVPGAVATLFGALLGTLAVARIPADLLRQAIPVLIAGSAVYVLVRRRPAGGEGPPPAPGGLRQAALGAPLGFYDGFFGPGVGAFWTTGALAVFHLDLVRASGVARYMNLVSNAVSLATFAALGLVDWPLGLLAGSVLMVGAWVGAHTAIRYGAAFIRPAFAVVVLLIAARLAWEGWAGP